MKHGALLLLLAAAVCGGCDSSDDDALAADAGGAGHDAAVFVPALGDDPTRVRVEGGELRGDVLGDAVRFLKIPYARPPVGELRWKAPQDAEPWRGARHEAEFASPCPQPASQQTERSTNEDCLYLNVWRPTANEPGAPVMVWIHGGGFTTGSAADIVPSSGDHLWYDGKAFAERGVVLVTINYRLGVMGFFAHEDLAAEGSPVGNQGLFDQRKALQWVHDNIAAFGGDPSNVTIFGQSAGSGSVCSHVASPGSRGLFQRAIGESGGCTMPRVTDRATIDERLAQFASDHGCAGEQPLHCLRELPASELVSTETVDRTMGMDVLRAQFSFGAVIDGEGGFMPEPAGALFDRGDIAEVPYLLGTTNDEAQLYFPNATVPTTEDEYVAYVKDKYGDLAERVLAMYPSAKFDGDYRKAVVRIATDSGAVCSTLDTARRAQKAGLPVFMYNFNIPWGVAPDLFGACHVSEISLVFDSPYPESDHPEVAHAMNAYWASFAETGDPNFDGAPARWPAFAPDKDGNDERLQFDPDGYQVVKSFRKSECALWADYARP